MRKKLRNMNGQRMRFTATVERFGEKSSFRGPPAKTVLLGNVCVAGDESIVTDHIWFTKGKSWDATVAGCTVEFDARVTKYEKGYKGNREVYDSPITIDYRLERPTKVEVKHKKSR